MQDQLIDARLLVEMYKLTLIQLFSPFPFYLITNGIN